MKIDLTNVGVGHELSNYELEVLKSGRLYQNLSKINEKKFNYLIVSMDVFSIIEHHHWFKPAINNRDEMSSIWLVGSFGEFQCYVDLLSPSNLISMQYDKQTSRDNKLESILDGTNIINEIKVTIDF